MKTTQSQIAKYFNISDSLFSRILSGDRNITYKLAKKLNKVSKIEKEFWLEGDILEIRQELLKLQIPNCIK